MVVVQQRSWKHGGMPSPRTPTLSVSASHSVGHSLHSPATQSALPCMDHMVTDTPLQELNARTNSPCTLAARLHRLPWPDSARRGRFFFILTFFLTNFNSNTIVFFSNLTFLAALKSVARPKHAIVPHVLARLNLPHRITIFTWKSLPCHRRWCGSTIAHAIQAGAGRRNLRKIISFS
jgi:hypothetical protein